MLEDTYNFKKMRIKEGYDYGGLYWLLLVQLY